MTEADVELVLRLRFDADIRERDGDVGIPVILREAAARIEALLVELEEWRDALAKQCGKTMAAEAQLAAKEAECERLRAVLGRIAKGDWFGDDPTVFARKALSEGAKR